MTVFATFFLDDGSRTYTPDDRDVFWLAKSLYRESTSEAGRVAAAWCMMQRFLRWPGGRWATWTDMMRAFSKPINPIWADPDSAKCQKFKADCTPELIALRQKIQGWQWEDIPWTARKVALEFSQGRWGSPVPSAVDFASKTSVSNQGKIGVTIGGNTFIDASQTDQSWKHPYVSVDPVFDLPAEGVDPDVDFDFDYESQDNVETELVKRPFSRWLGFVGFCVVVFFASRALKKGN